MEMQAHKICKHGIPKGQGTLHIDNDAVALNEGLHGGEISIRCCQETNNVKSWSYNAFWGISTKYMASLMHLNKLLGFFDAPNNTLDLFLHISRTLLASLMHSRKTLGEGFGAILMSKHSCLILCCMEKSL